MHRKPIGENECAFFEFPRLGKHSFWNKDVSFPISLIFCNDKFEVKDVKYLEANQTSGVAPKGYDIKYVIEAHVDVPKRMKISNGNKIKVDGNKLRIDE
jgi:uncharacterized membrane protein (UPF0127 family)